MSGFSQFANTPSRKKRKDYAQLVSTTNVTDVVYRQGSGGKIRVAFMNVMQGVAMKVPSVQSGTNFGTTSSPGILGDGSGFNFGSWTPQTSCMVDPTGIFHLYWNITCETDVLDSTCNSDFISNVFPQVTLSQMDKMSTDKISRRRHAHMVQSVAYNVGFDRRHKTELEEARGLAVVAYTEASEYKTKYELTKKNQQEEHDRFVHQVSNLELEVANLSANDSDLVDSSN
ncbi:unnamed protein product [Lactuca virosa]|uniref:Uncharacterized protein n=1 Tax=Lactuca virosa TaxID=75947 RepID=A0AAU9P6K1_9ASTR|nr:unnamed protein product [Lactuca virosa]